MLRGYEFFQNRLDDGSVSRRRIQGGTCGGQVTGGTGVLGRCRGRALCWWFGDLLGSFNTWSRGGGCDIKRLSATWMDSVRVECCIEGSSQI